MSVRGLGPITIALLVGCSSGEPTVEPIPTAHTIDIRIANGEVSPVNTRTEAEVGQRIVLRVDSDATDELHVHSAPAHTFPVAATVDQEFAFSVAVPGRVEIELHQLGRTVTTLLVRQ
ncbi:hypothetical protein [Nocardia caishijiensis]|uniref:EfeO-type cupredoxin-like domain-containing protein n=1 Tax=Nocardia caishijiensis TaxID=184756 RepID=A0ABQ6YGG9_9NOCA|nr:hypothetical protein [Nocardia caishijiensis]KAF0844806.1 hypothetical protein FNL39_11038 [Nocardia caishijiensis]